MSRISHKSQSRTPLLSALQTAAHRSGAAFYTPGHKRGQGTASIISDVLGHAVFQADLPELPELDNLFAPDGVLRDAQALAADAFGADQTWFLVNGSTCGIEAAVLASCRPGDKLIVPRNSHRSAIAALILSGAIPIFVEPEYDADWQLAHSITPAGVAAALNEHPDAKAVLMLSPTYHGVCGAVEAIAQLAHQHSIPLLVDEAHGPHFGFHPQLPPPALIAGADVVVQSIHKVLSAMTQSAMLHLKGTRVSGDRISQALQLLQSSSPSYVLLASLDAARQQMATQGTELMTHTLELAERARTQLQQISKLRVLSIEVGQTPGCMAIDPTRLTIDVTGLGLTGFAADEILHQQFGVTAELPALQHLTFIITLGNTVEDIDRLVQAFAALATDSYQTELPHISHPPFSRSQLPELSPRDAFFAPLTAVSLKAAIGQISSETVCPYPPGIPILFPGERVTAEAIDYLQAVLTSGGIITGCSDPDLQTLRVVDQ